MSRFVPDEFLVPPGLIAEGFTLEPLGPRHNAADHAAWMSSIDHIRATPGFGDGDWPEPMRLEDNLADLEMHAGDFAARAGFTYTVLGADRDVIGCVYIYPSADPDHDANVRSWVRASHAHLDEPLQRAVTDWLAADWPFRSVRYAAR